MWMVERIVQPKRASARPGVIIPMPRRGSFGRTTRQGLFSLCEPRHLADIDRFCLSSSKDLIAVAAV